MKQSEKYILTQSRITYIFLFLHFTPLVCEPILSLFFKPAPDAQHYSNKIKKPGKLAKYTIQGLIGTDFTTGIMGTYAGYIHASTDIGQLIFPRKQDSETLLLAITTQISPIMRFEQTVDHWQFVPGVPASLFELTRKHSNEKKFYWEITKKELPESNIIDYTSLIIFAKPKNIHVPLGNTKTIESPNLLLPDLYVKKAINVVKHATYILQLKHLFRQVTPNYKKEPKRYSIALPT